MAHWRQLADFDLEFLTEVLLLIDSKLGELAASVDQIEDPDMTGHYDRTEYVTGFGLVACQQYIAAVMGGVGSSARRDGLNLGPIHRLGDPMVAIINAAANYWKHSSEWTAPADGRTEGGRKETRAMLLKVGADPKGSYPLTCVLAALLSPLPYQFVNLLPVLEEWRDAWFREKFRQRQVAKSKKE